MVWGQSVPLRQVLNYHPEAVLGDRMVGPANRRGVWTGVLQRQGDKATQGHLPGADGLGHVLFRVHVISRAF